MYQLALERVRVAVGSNELAIIVYRGVIGAEVITGVVERTGQRSHRTRGDRVETGVVAKHIDAGNRGQESRHVSVIFQALDPAEQVAAVVVGPV